jgi:LppP/LprE lipoprotein
VRSIVLAMFVGVMWIALSTPQQAQAAPAQGCGVNLAAPEIQTINSVPTVPQGWPWSHDPRSFDPSSNYNPCATLSAVIITVEGATGSSPEQALLFHNGNYVGTGTSKAYAFTSLNAAQTTDDTVALNHKDGRNVCTACPEDDTTRPGIPASAGIVRRRRQARSVSREPRRQG